MSADSQTDRPVTEPTLTTEDKAPRSPSSLRYLLLSGVMLAALGAWGLMKLQDMRETNKEERAAYVVQDFEESDSEKKVETFDLPVADQKSPEIKVTLTRDPSPEEVAAIDLTQGQVDKAADLRARRNRTLETAGSLMVEPPKDTDVKPKFQPGPKPVAVVDLDYSQKNIPPMGEKELNTTLEDLQARLSEVIPQAQEAKETDDIDILNARLAELVAGHQSKVSPISPQDRLELTRKATELRDEIVVFAADLKRAGALRK